MKKAIIIILILLVVLTGVGAALWFFTPLFDFLKPARDNFATQAKKLFGAKTEMSYDDYIKSIEPLKAEQKSFVAKTNISANVTLPSDVVDYTTQRQINNTTISVEASYDTNSKATSSSVNWKYLNGDILNLKMVKNGKKITLSSKDFYDKAVTLDMSKIKEYCKNNNIEVTDEQIAQIEKSFDSNSADELSAMMYDLLYLTEDEYKALKKNYGDILKKYIDKKNYTTEKKKTISVNGDDVKATGYSLTISGEDVYNLIKNIAKDAKKDDNLKSIVVNKVNLLKKHIGTLAEQGASEVELGEIEELLGKDIESSDVEEVIDAFLEEFESVEDTFKDFKKSLKVTIYADSKSNPVRLDVAIVKDAKDEGDVIFSKEVGSKKNTYTIDVQKVIKVIADITESDMSTASIPVDKIVVVDEIEKNNDEERSGKLTISVKASGQKMEVATVDYEIVTSDSEIKRNFTITSALAGVNVQIKCEALGLDTDNQTAVFDIDAAVASYKVKLNIDSSVTYGSSNIETYNESNSVDLFSMSKDDANKVITDIVTKMSDVLPGRLANYGIKITKEDIMSIVQETTVTEPADDTTTEDNTEEAA